MHRLRRVGETGDAAADVLDPSLATVREAVDHLPPRGEMVLDDLSGPGERFCQVRRSPQDAEYWQVEVRLDGDGGHFVTRVTFTDQVCAIFAAWGVNSARLPPGPRWAPFDGSSVYAQRPYDLTVYLAGLSVTPLWDRQQWNRLVPLLAPMFSASDRGRTVVQSLQDDLSAEGHRVPLVKFGALSFADRSHRKWTHEVATSRRFRSVEVSAPGSRASYRQGTPPDSFFAIHAPDGSAASGYQFWVMLALAADRPQPDASALDQGLTALLDPLIVARKRRPWGLSTREGSFGSPIDSLVPVRNSTGRSGGELIVEDRPIPGVRLEHWRVDGQGPPVTRNVSR